MRLQDFPLWYCSNLFDCLQKEEKGGEELMEAKTIIAIVLVAVIIGGFIFLQVKNRKK